MSSTNEAAYRVSKARASISTLTWVSRPIKEAILRAQKMGFRWIDIGVIQDWTAFGVVDLIERGDAILSELDSLLTSAGVGVRSLNATIRIDESAPSTKEQTEALAYTAKRLDAPAGVTVQPPPAGTSAERVDAFLAPVLDVFRQWSVPLSIETHVDTVAEEVDQAVAICRRHPGLLLTVDTSHFIFRGVEPAAWNQVGPYAAHYHLRWCNGESLQTDAEHAAPAVADWLQTALTAGYTGPIGIEMIEGLGGVDAEAASAALWRAFGKEL